MSPFSALFTALWQKAFDWTRKPEDRGYDTQPPSSRNTAAGPLTLSPESIRLIIDFETGSRAYYEKKLQRPTWPGGASGVTIGFGYDIGYQTPTQVHADWDGLLPPHSVEALSRVSGVRGTKAISLIKGLAHIIVPWDKAQSVFERRTLPRFGKQAADAFPHLADCHPHVQGALLSLVFNRGPALTGKNRQDMMDIHRILADGVQSGDYALIATQLREMKSIWQGQGLDGLLRRREAEAQLIESILV
jgi:GH24 family phage-related lysozyme (muramidase)